MSSTKNEIKVVAPVESAIAYRLNGITYLPHYKNRSLFVGPGYPVGEGDPLPNHTYTANELREAGGEEVNLLLWPRSRLLESAQAR